uniref:Uncharacterized protein n=1 Tax=viral metagenome TaxID=1070528 RepID=A0A6M3KWF3_9ZZZZ
MNQDLFIIPTEDAALDDVLIFPIGGFVRDGVVRKFTAEQAQEMVGNFKTNVLGRYIPVNREHKREAGRVARIADLWLSDDGVRGKLQEVEGQEGALAGFDYLSPEVAWSWVNPHTGQEHKNVLVGLAATNYPFFGGQMSLNSSPQVWNGSEWEVYQDSERDEQKERRAARASRYSIAVKEKSALTYPAGFPENDADYGDPVNYRYPADAEHAKAALGYFNQGGQRDAGGYTSSEWAIIGRRLARLISKHLSASYEYDDGRLVQRESSSDTQTEGIMAEQVEKPEGLEDILTRLALVEGVAEDVATLKALLAEKPQVPEAASDGRAEEYAQKLEEYAAKLEAEKTKREKLEAEVFAERRKRELMEWTERVQSFSMAGEPEKFAEDMLTIAGINADVAERTMARFRAAQEQINVGGLFEQYSQAGSEADDGRSAFEREVEKVRMERFAALPYAEGFTEAFRAVGSEKPELARQYVKGGK